MKYEISGEITLNKQKRKFTKKIDAKSEKMACEKTYALFGSSNRIKRSCVTIGKVEKVA